MRSGSPQRHRLAAQPAEHRLVLLSVDIPGAKTCLSEPQHRAAHLASQAGVTEQAVFELSPDTAVELARIDVVIGGHLADGESASGGGERHRVVRREQQPGRDLFPVDATRDGEEELVDHVQLRGLRRESDVDRLRLRRDVDNSRLQ
ncbi:MAG: hypothetical protein ACR2KG_06855 [Nocardioidaceae bacterium]